MTFEELGLAWPREEDEQIIAVSKLLEEIASLKQQLAEAQSRASTLSGLVIETYSRNSSRLRDDDARTPPWASE